MVRSDGHVSCTHAAESHAHPDALLPLALLPAELEVILGGILELLVIVLWQVAHHVLIHSICEEDDLQVLLQQLLKEGRLCQLSLLVPCTLKCRCWVRLTNF